MSTDIRNVLAACTLDRYETEFADRHLLPGAVTKWAKETPDEIAIVDFDSGRQFTYRQFDQATTGLALALLDAGYRPGDFLATMLPLLPEHVLLEYACFKIGVVHVPLDLRLKGAEVVRSLDLVKARGFAFLGKTPAADFREIGRVVQNESPYIEHFLQFSAPQETIDGATSFASFAADAQQLAAQRDSQLYKQLAQISESIRPTDGAQVIYTTGSTGLPKPALLSHRNITAQNMCLAAGFDLFDSPRMLVNLPPSHVGCQGEQIMTTFFTGKTAVILHIFDVEKTLQASSKSMLIVSDRSRRCSICNTDCPTSPSTICRRLNASCMEAYRKTVSTDGVCYTGDLGYVSDRGLAFSGRSKLVIKPKGYQVHPGQIESHFAELTDQVSACGAVGAAHDIFSEGVVLFVELKPGAKLSRERLDAHAKQIASYMRPSHYVMLEPGAFPLNRVSKTDYVRLAELANAEVDTLRSQGGWDTD